MPHLLSIDESLAMSNEHTADNSLLCPCCENGPKVDVESDQLCLPYRSLGSIGSSYRIIRSGGQGMNYFLSLKSKLLCEPPR